MYILMPCRKKYIIINKTLSKRWQNKLSMSSSYIIIGIILPFLSFLKLKVQKNLKKSARNVTLKEL